MKLSSALNNHMTMCEIEQFLLNHKELVSLAESLSTPLIALFAVIYAALSWSTDRRRLSHELFDRRYVYFIAVKKLFGELTSYGKMSPEAEREFLISTAGIKFAYSEEIEKYIENVVWKMALRLNLYNEEMHPSNGIAKERAEHMLKILSEIKECEKKFSKYLQLKS